MPKLLPVALAVLGLSLVVSPAFAGDELELGNAKKGEKVFLTFCVACHGATGQGDGPAGAALTPRPRDFTDAALMHAISDEQLLTVISEGGASVGKSAMMPAWGSSLKPAELRDVAAYVRAFAGVAVPAEAAAPE